MACPRILSQSVNLCSRVCRVSARATARPHLLNSSSKITRQQSLPVPRQFSTSTSDLLKEGRLFSKDHEWILPEEDIRTGTIGISDFAQEKLGDIVYIELPQTGIRLAKGDSYGVVESVKAASDLCAMIDGKVKQTNKALDKSPELVNSDPLVAGWMLKMTIDHPEQLEELMSQEEYEEYISKASDS
ncbi:glycine cleavage system H protein-like [Asterias rubens]|uniref:glycine cleavage system H protein-like n=1 Tax=Asterias rubens TaxID=7604 RepID=UPI0014551311|nr:glycine cleavage system H protein-like [Asterias rubens]